MNRFEWKVRESDAVCERRGWGGRGKGMGREMKGGWGGR